MYQLDPEAAVALGERPVDGANLTGEEQAAVQIQAQNWRALVIGLLPCSQPTNSALLCPCDPDRPRPAA